MQVRRSRARSADCTVSSTSSRASGSSVSASREKQFLARFLCSSRRAMCRADW